MDELIGALVERDVTGGWIEVRSPDGVCLGGVRDELSERGLKLDRRLTHDFPKSLLPSPPFLRSPNPGDASALGEGAATAGGPGEGRFRRKRALGARVLL